MIKNKDKTALILSILSIVFNLLYWLFMLIGILLNLPDKIACIGSIITYVFTFAVAITAILLKNNIAEKMSVIYIALHKITKEQNY